MGVFLLLLVQSGLSCSSGWESSPLLAEITLSCYKAAGCHVCAGRSGAAAGLLHAGHCAGQLLLLLLLPGGAGALAPTPLLRPAGAAAGHQLPAFGVAAAAAALAQTVAC